MKKLTFIIVTFALVQSSFGQFNPINNLECEHWYVCPNNYFVLQWDLPDSSQDTLIGYNIYRETDLYKFQTETSLYHTEAGGNCGEDFAWYNEGGEFWVHVTALYNSSHQESIYNDSVFCFGYAIGLDEIIHSNLTLFPNPTSGKFKIDSEFDIKRIAIISQTGGIINEYTNTTEFDLSAIPKGVYFIKIWTDKDVLLKAVIVE